MTRSAAAPASGFGNLPAEPAGLRAAAPAAGLRDGAAPGLASLRFRVEARADVNAAAPLARLRRTGGGVRAARRARHGRAAQRSRSQRRCSSVRWHEAGGDRARRDRGDHPGPWRFAAARRPSAWHQPVDALPQARALGRSVRRRLATPHAGGWSPCDARLRSTHRPHTIQPASRRTPPRASAKTGATNPGATRPSAKQASVPRIHEPPCQPKYAPAEAGADIPVCWVLGLLPGTRPWCGCENGGSSRTTAETGRE